MNSRLKRLEQRFKPVVDTVKILLKLPGDVVRDMTTMAPTEPDKVQGRVIIFKPASECQEVDNHEQ